MSPKPKKPTSPPKPHRSTFFAGRDGLGAYTADPASFPAFRVIEHDKKWVVINDLYPKSSVHILLLPRDPSKALLHPFEALADPEFLADVQAKVRKLRAQVATELRRRYGKFSALDKSREEALDAEPPPTSLPHGRDWSKDVISGVHASPSMNHLHIHILSVDRVNECMKHRKHYNSFNTPFLLDVEDFPLAEDDVRRHPGTEGYLDAELRCWRCGKEFGNRFLRLKKHLGEEFEEWMRV